MYVCTRVCVIITYATDEIRLQVSPAKCDKLWAKNAITTPNMTTRSDQHAPTLGAAMQQYSSHDKILSQMQHRMTDTTHDHDNAAQN